MFLYLNIFCVSRILLSLKIIAFSYRSGALPSRFRPFTKFTPLLSLQKSMSRINVSQSYEKLEKPLLDERVFDQFKLPNEILVTLVHDKRSEKSSCSLGVAAGASSDSLPGLAHMTEHAVFLGSEKYPTENEYKKFLNKNGGGSNGGTSMKQTIYKFYINSAAFPQALDIFSQFFKSPLLQNDALAREIHAVDSEDSKNRILEGRRLLQVLKHQIDPSATSYYKFSTGNIKTLTFGDVSQYSDLLTTKVKEFHSRYYRPDQMAVCLVGPQSIEELRALAFEKFSDIQKFGLQPEQSSLKVDKEVTESSEVCPVVFKHSSSKLIKIKPVRDLRDLSMIFTLPYSKELYRCDPCYLLSYVLSYKGEGSLYGRLHDLGYITSLSAHVRTHYTDFLFYEISLSLTVNGLQHYENVLKLVRVYLKLIDEEVSRGSYVLTPDSTLYRIWNEMRSIKKINFLYEDMLSAYELSPALVENMLDYPMHEIMSVGQLLDETFSVSKFQSYLTKLLNDSCLIVLRSKDFSHLPNDDVSKLSELMQSFEASSASVEDIKTNGDYFLLFRRWLDDYQRDTPVYSSVSVNPEASKSSSLEYEPFYGVPYEISDLCFSDNSKQSSEKSMHLPGMNRFISYDLLNYTTATSHELDETREIEWDNPSFVVTDNVKTVNSRKEKPLQSDPPKLLACFDEISNAFKLFPNEFAVGQHPSKSIRNSLWYSVDQIFGTPKTVVYFFFRNSHSGMFFSLFVCVVVVLVLFLGENHPVSALIGTIFDQMTIKRYYDSSIAGLHHSLSLGQRLVCFCDISFSRLTVSRFRFWF
jgi:secreted Zn-dependent insulinase-like peptidase